MVQLHQAASLQFEVLEVSNLPVAPEVPREKFYVTIKVGGPDGGSGSTRIVKSSSANHRFTEEQGNKILLHYGAIERGEKATISVQVWESRGGAPDELVGSNTVDISKILLDARFNQPELSTVLVRLKEAGGPKGPRGEVKLNITILPPLRGVVRFLGKSSELFTYRDALVDRLVAVRNFVLFYTWGYVKGPASQSARYVVSNRKILFTSAATAIAVLASLIGLALAFLIPAGLFALFTFPLWILPVSAGALFTSPLWVPVLVTIAVIVGTLSTFGLFLALTSPPLRGLAGRFFIRFRESPTGKRLLFTSAVDETPTGILSGAGNGTNHE